MHHKKWAEKKKEKRKETTTVNCADGSHGIIVN